MKSQMNPGSIPIPKGDTKQETPDGVTKTYDNGEYSCNSAYDAMGYGNGMSYGAFPYEGMDGTFAVPMMSSRKTETTKRKDE